MLVVVGGTVIDGTGRAPIEDGVIMIEKGRITAIGDRSIPVPQGVEKVDWRDKYIIPGLMNANVHLLCDARLENLVRFLGRYEELIVEAAQVALKNGLTTVFDTWGPRRHLSTVRDRINAGEVPGSRIFCAGNIIGFDGPFSPDFYGKTVEVASGALVKRINATWVENVGRRLMWLTPDQVGHEVRSYVGKGIDFVKYASNEHGANAGAFVAFSDAVQLRIVKEAHRADMTAQAHTMSVEGLRMAIDAGCNLVQHANVTGPVPIPESTLELMAKRGTGAVVFPWTQGALDWLAQHLSDMERTTWAASDTNARNFIQSGASILLANDGSIFAPEVVTDASFSKGWGAVPGEDGLVPLGQGHFTWLRAMEEKGMDPMEMLKAATRNIAVAYGKDEDLGTLEPGKIADLLVLDKNPLERAENYRCIHAVIKDGAIVDTEGLPANPILTLAMNPPAVEEASYVPFLQPEKFPMRSLCAHR